MVFGKNGKTELNLPTILLIAIVAMMIPGVPEKLSGFLGLSAPGAGTTTGGTTTGNTNAGGTCVDPTVKVTMTLDSEEMYNPTTVPGGDNAVWLNGKYVGMVPNLGTLTVSPGDAYKILWVANSSTHYGKVSEGTVPCSGTLRLHEKIVKMDVGSASTTWANIYNDKGQDNSVNNISLAAGDVKSIKAELKGTYKKSIGNANLGTTPNILSCRYNTSSFDEVVLGDFEKTDTPGMITGVAGYTWTSVKFPAIVSNEMKTMLVTLNANDVVDPSDDASDVFCRLDDGDYDIHGTTNDVISGVQDEVKNDLGMAGAIWNFTINIQ